tara:strand:+ start:53 stop:427 length:375 start_codon:yes stop_codon:yes gene_type:complete
MKNDMICGHDLTYQVRVGFHDFERNIQQRVKINFAAETNWKQAVAKDEPVDIVDYYLLNEAIEKMVSQKSWNLIESLAEDVAKLICTKFNVQAVEVRVNKKPLDMPNVSEVSACCYRRKEDYKN